MRQLPQSAIYHGVVTHKRLAPVAHALAYRVFTLFADVDELPHLSRRLRFFSYNRFNLLSLSDRDHGPGDGTPVAVHARQLFDGLQGGPSITRVFMLCYPRLLGYVFNPLTVYYGYDAENRLAAMAYEVNNTLGNRVSYVIPAPAAAAPDESFAQACDKAMWVSPFNTPTGHYGFRVGLPGEALVIAVTLRDGDGPKLKALFRGNRQPLTNPGLLRMVAAVPALTFKVMAGIHWEALKLWLKGLKLVARPAPPPPVIWARTPGDV